jgi:Tol biopolymer transport system component
VGEGIKDLSGEALGATVRIPFTTGASQLAFVRDGQIFVMDPVGGAVRQLTAGGRDAWPTWSPDGRRIAFVRFPGPNSVGEIYLMDADGSSTTALFAPIPYGGWGMEFRFAAWSPDGRLLAVHHSNIYYGDIYLLGVDNVDNPMVPVHVASMAAWPAWSPDGKKLAFVRLSGDDGYHDLYSMSMDGSDVSLLASGDGGSIWGPTWSPDGQRIAFSMCRPYDGCDIFTVSANATAATAEDRLTTVGGALFPAWSPDGRWIAFTWWRDGGGTSVGGETSVALVEANRSSLSRVPVRRGSRERT